MTIAWNNCHHKQVYWITLNIFTEVTVLISSLCATLSRMVNKTPHT